MAGTTTWTVARKKAAAWGTAVAVGAGDGVKIMSESLPSGIPTPIKDDNVGDSLSGGTYQGNTEVEGNMVIPVRFAGIERDIALLMGQAGAPTQIEAGVAYLHTMPFAPDNDGLFATLAFDKGIGALGSAVNEIPSAKYGSLEFGFDGGKAVLTVGMICNRVERDNPTNGATELGNVTFPTNGLLGLFSATTLRITEITGAEGNLTVTEDILVADPRITINRNISGDHVTGSNGEIDEPVTDGLPEAQLIVTFTKHTAAVEALIAAAGTLQDGRIPKVYKAQLFVTGPQLPGTASANAYFLYWDLPALTIADAPTNAGGPGAKVPVEMTFDIVTPQADSLPDGTDWAWVAAGTNPFRCRVQNATNVDPLA